MYWSVRLITHFMEVDTGVTSNWEPTTGTCFKGLAPRPSFGSGFALPSVPAVSCEGSDGRWSRPWRGCSAWHAPKHSNATPSTVSLIIPPTAGAQLGQTLPYKLPGA